MHIPKLKVLVEAGAVREVEAIPDAEGWAVWVVYASHSAQRQNAEAAAVKRLELLIAAQRRQVAHHAGERWRALLDYLSGKLRELPEG